jgi:hypothetical protein
LTSTSAEGPEYPSCLRAALAAEAIVGGNHEVVFNRILTDRIGELPGLVDDLLVTILMLDAGDGTIADHRLGVTNPHPPTSTPGATNGNRATAR